ncbi:MAG: extracellular solute-binding protein [Erysipelotrichaceae bacterium]|nr:extracellular solute-binding protein [Erysipelotrichaceae bacterium]
MKKLVKLVLALAMVLGLTACGGGKTSGVTVEVWHTFTEGQEKLLETIADEFEAANAGVTVNVINTGSPDDFKGKVTDSVANGVGPNVIFDFASYATTFDIEGQNYLLDLEKYWGNWDYKGALSSAGLYEEATNFSDGKLHVAPVYTAGALLFSNEAIYEACGVKVPTTWDEMKTAAKTIYEKTGIVGLALDSPSDFMQLLIYQANGGQIVDLENNKVAFNTAEVEKWLEWWAEGVQEGYFVFKAIDAGGYCSADINNAAVASYIGSSAGIPYLNFDGKTFVTELTDAETQIFTTSKLLEGKTAKLVANRVPMMDPNDEYGKAGIIWTRSAIGFNSGNEDENQAAADFIKFFVEQNERWVIELNANTPYKAVEESATYQAHVAGDKALTALAEQVPVSFVAPNFQGVSEMREEAKTLAQGVLAAGWNAKTALQTAADKVQAAMDK